MKPGPVSWESDAKADGREVLNLEMRAVKKFRE